MLGASLWLWRFLLLLLVYISDSFLLLFCFVSGVFGGVDLYFYVFRFLSLLESRDRKCCRNFFGKNHRTFQSPRCRRPEKKTFFSLSFLLFSPFFSFLLFILAERFSDVDDVTVKTTHTRHDNVTVVTSLSTRADQRLVQSNLSSAAWVLER